jgi:hypothetical protein
MYFSRLAIAVAAVSMSVVAQTPRHSEYLLFCPSQKPYRNPFVRTVVDESLSNTLLKPRVDMKNVIPPPEFRRHALLSDTTDSHSATFTLWGPPEGCQLIHIDEKGQIH